MNATIKTQATLPKEPCLWGLMAEYDDVDSLIAAAQVVRDAGFKRWDCHTPFPVHGLDGAMGIKKTILPWIVLGAGLTGCFTAIVLQWFINTPHAQFGGFFSFISSYPLIISGKPFWSLPANIPVIFELTVLFSALTTFFCVWGLCGLPKFYHPTFSVPRFKKVTDDKFFIVIESRDEKFDAQATRTLLESTHQSAIEEIKD